jgi:hypothetical protein
MSEPVESRSIPRLLLEAAVVVVFALLIWKNYTLRRQLHASVPSVREHAFVARDAIASVPIIDLAGKPGTLDLKSGRTLLAIVDPRCDSCRELVSTIHGASNLRVLSVASAEETRPMAQELGLTAVTSTLGKPLPKPIATQIQIYPQLLIVDRGLVVRTCASFAECAR